MSLKAQASCPISLPQGDFQMIAYADCDDDPVPHFAIVYGEPDTSSPVMVRIHSECITGDLFGSKRCDCGPQLKQALNRIAQDGGVVIYLRQEGRGIGIINKLKAYNLQDAGLDTVDANIHLGFLPDQRKYEVAISILQNLKIQKIKLLTNNPNKIQSFEGTGIKVIKRVPIIIPPIPENLKYLKTKNNLMGHLLNL